MELLKSPKTGSNGNKCKLLGFLFASIVGGMSPGEAKKTWDSGDKSIFCFETRGKKTEFECKCLMVG